MTPLANANIEVLDQLKSLIKICARHYENRENDKGIGPHVRHVLDHYRAIQIGLNDKSINYNLRTRNSLEEQDFQLALKSIESIQSWLSTVETDDLIVNVLSEISTKVSLTEEMSSTFKRELLYMTNHAIHHMAYIAQMAIGYGVSVPSHIGLAPSTLHQHQETSSDKQEKKNALA